MLFNLVCFLKFLKFFIQYIILFPSHIIKYIIFFPLLYNIIYLSYYFPSWIIIYLSYFSLSVTLLRSSPSSYPHTYKLCVLSLQLSQKKKINKNNNNAKISILNKRLPKEMEAVLYWPSTPTHGACLEVWLVCPVDSTGQNKLYIPSEVDQWQYSHKSTQMKAERSSHEISKQATSTREVFFLAPS